MKKEFVSLKNTPKKTRSIWVGLLFLFLNFFSLSIATLICLPGALFHWHLIIFSIFNIKNIKILMQTIFIPFDSVRYYEFKYFFDAFKKIRTIKDYLDMSSPRLLPFFIIKKKKPKNIILMNPDKKDLEETKKIFSILKSKEISYFENIVQNFNNNSKYDLITSMSVIEHIPDGEDVIAIKKLWGLLNPGGILVISVPFHKSSFEEYINFNEYGILKQDDSGFFFGQRFYDEQLLQDRFYLQIGKPFYQCYFGERKKNYFFNNRKKKVEQNNRYPFFLEPLLARFSYKKYSKLTDMPGVGIVVMGFKKDENSCY